jgi:hypothetical protein
MAAAVAVTVWVTVAAVEVTANDLLYLHILILRQT